jgi:hypothetical protein
LPGSGFYCLLEGSDLAQNERLSVRVGEGTQATGTWVPQTAVLVGENDTWVYVEPEDGHFVRVRVDVSKPQDDGFFLPPETGIAPEARVVTGAAGLLLAREVNPVTNKE